MDKLKLLPLLLLSPLTVLGSHGDPYASDFLGIFFLLIGAIFGAFLARKLKQPPVLGELMIGMLVGTALYQLGDPVAIAIRHNSEIEHVIQAHDAETSWEEAVHLGLEEAHLRPEVEEELTTVLLQEDYRNIDMHARYTLLFSSMGVILLLFMVGLEIKTTEMIGMGKPAFILATLGVIFPFVLGYLASILLFPDIAVNTAIFIGATLGATSIGITARVFKDANALHFKESKLVLGAAVIDDILGLILLAIVTGLISSGGLDVTNIMIILAKAIGFLLGVYLFEKYAIQWVIDRFAYLARERTFLFFPIALLFFLSWSADAIGLATIVGAFAAGLVIQEKYFNHIKMEHQSIEDLVSPIEELFAPVFFVMMGFQVDISAFMQLDVILLGVTMTIVAMVGKVIAGFFTEKGNNKWLIGVGLIPRGEVGLIFASIGKASGVLDDHLFAVIIMVVILTTLLTPPILMNIIKKMPAKA